MNGFNKFLAATFLSAAMLFSSAVQAMEIRQFDKMADQDLNHQGGGPQPIAKHYLSGLERLAVTANLADQRNEIPAPAEAPLRDKPHATGSEFEAQGELHEARRG